MKKQPKALPPLATAYRDGWRLQIRMPDGSRLGARKLDPREPSYYTTQAALWQAYETLTAQVQRGIEYSDTVSGFLAEWTDVDHHRWGKDRSEQSMQTYRSSMRKFEEMYGERKLATITVQDIDRFLATKPAASNATTLGMFFRDALRAQKCLIDPTADFDLDRPEPKEEDAPEPELLAAMHAYALGSKRIPRSLYQWLLVGSGTGMRTGELDAMAIDKLDLNGPDGPLYLIDRQYHARLRDFTEPKWGSVRTILLPPTVIEEIERAVFYARQIGSPFLFNNSAGHWTPDSRKWYWQKIGDDSLRLRLATPERPEGVSMKAATRTYFATQMVMLAPHRIPQIAHHYGHKDKGVTLLKHYTKLNDRRGQLGMADVYAAMPERSAVVDLSARRAS